MKMDDEHVGAPSGKTRIEQAEARTEEAKRRADLAETRTELAETRTELAKTRTEQAEIRTEEAETRTEQAQTRTEQAEARTEQAESALERLVHQKADPREGISPPPKDPPLNEVAVEKNPLEELTSRQREIFQLIAEGQNTKQIAEMLKISAKTVEYHRAKLMAGLNVHDVPGLVRLAMRVGLIAP